MNASPKQSDTRNGRLLILPWGLFVIALIIDFTNGTRFPITAFYIPAIVTAILYSKVNIKLVSSMTCFAILIPLVNHFLNESPLTVIVPMILSRIIILGTVTLISIRYQREKERSLLLSKRDPLTGLTNQPAFMDLVQSEIERSRRNENSFSLLYIDCDDFRIVNESKGHPVGDELLISIARTLASSIRKYDSAGRMGGDEFCLLFPETGHQQSRSIVDRIQSELTQCMIEIRLNITFSIGVVTFYDLPESAKEAVTVADRAMYQRKNAEKNGFHIQVVGDPANETLTSQRLTTDNQI